MRYAIAAVVLALVVLGCGKSYPAGGRGGGDGTGGSGGGGAPGGSGGGTGPGYPGAHEPRTVELPGLMLELAADLFAPVFSTDGILPHEHRLYLVERPLGCRDATELAVGEGEGLVMATIWNARPGACPLRDPFGLAYPQMPRDCQATVTVARLGVAGKDGIGGTVRIDALAGDRIAGRFEALVPVRDVEALGCSWSDDGEGVASTCTCAGDGELFECEGTGETPCCWDGEPTVLVEIPFDSALCEAATECGVLPCAPGLAASCDPPAPDGSSACEAACADYARVCDSCWGTGWYEVCGDGGEDCSVFCDEAWCLDRCRALAGADPLVSLALGCTAGAATCDDWTACVSTCGGR